MHMYDTWSRLVGLMLLRAGRWVMLFDGLLQGRCLFCMFAEGTTSASSDITRGSFPYIFVAPVVESCFLQCVARTHSPDCRHKIQRATSMSASFRASSHSFTKSFMRGGCTPRGRRGALQCFHASTISDQLEHVSSVQNKTVKHAVKLRTSAKYRNETARLLLAGATVLMEQFGTGAHAQRPPEVCALTCQEVLSWCPSVSQMDIRDKIVWTVAFRSLRSAVCCADLDTVYRQELCHTGPRRRGGSSGGHCGSACDEEARWSARSNFSRSSGRSFNATGASTHT